MVGHTVPFCAPPEIVTGVNSAAPLALLLRIAHSGLCEGVVSGIVSGFPASAVPKTPLADVGLSKEKPPRPPAVPCPLPSGTWFYT